MLNRVVVILVGLVLSTMAATSSAEVAVVFTQKEIAVIIDYYGGRHRDDQGGKHRHKGLPPGIAKNLARGKSLPPGIAKQHLPDDLLVRLPPVREGYERIIVDGKVILVEIATQVVHDVLSDIILK